MHTQCSRFAFTLLAGLTLAPMVFAQETLPRPDPAFNGKIGRTAKESIPDFPKEVHAPKGAPNILLIMTDDVGFGASSTFGGPIPTPALDRLAHNGLRYNQFHTTALCSPTRAALITGRNHHTAATGTIMEMGTGFPGYNTLMPKSVGTIAEVLEAERLQHGMVRQEPQRSRLAFECSRTVRSVAHGTGFRLLLRLSRRRHRSVASGDLREYAPHRCAGAARRQPGYNFDQ